jgi:hypothetical protein
MPEVVKVSTVEKSQSLMAAIEEYFKKGRYAEITQAIGMHSLLIDPQHTMSDQAHLYHIVLNLIKDKVRAALGKHYAAWYASFPKLMDELISSDAEVTDKFSIAGLASHREAYGPFKSVDDFFFWALDDRRLTLDEIIKYVEKTTEKACQ